MTRCPVPACGGQLVTTDYAGRDPGRETRCLLCGREAAAEPLPDPGPLTALHGLEHAVARHSREARAWWARDGGAR